MELNEVYGPPKETFQASLRSRKFAKLLATPGLKFHEHVAIAALGIKITAEN